MVHKECSFLVLSCGPARTHNARTPRRCNIMNIRSIAGAVAAGIALSIAVPATAHDTAETVTPNFQHAIPNIPGKSLIAVVVDYAPAAASHAHEHAKSAFIYAYVVSGAIESQVDDGPKR